MKALFLFFILFLFVSVNNISAQVTSARLAGRVVDEAGKTLPGVIIEAIHEPSGSKYGTDTKGDGSYDIENMRVGGPYKIIVTLGGTVVRTFDNVFIQLGETYELNIKAVPDTRELSGITVTSSRDNTFNNQRTGATTVISQEQINTLPSIGRSFSDFTRLTPQSYGSSFAGRNSLYNNVQINGANFNNAFGLSGGGYAGGGQPIPIDAVQQIQVGVSPFDVRQSDFTGANINMVTKSGNNDYSGSAYFFYRDQSFNGTHAGSYTLPPAIKTVNHIYGASVGGPIIKNKLFFFVNGEFENNIHPGATNWIAGGTGVTGPYISNAKATDLQTISDYVKTKYGYNTGAYDGYANSFANAYTRLIARIDYNINDKNKLNASFTHYNSAIPSMVNSSSAANGGISGSRFGQNSLAFENTMYSTKDIVNAISMELSTKINNDISNQLLGSYTMTRDTRSSPSSKFPFVDIEGGNGSGTDNYASLGYELFTYKNDVQYNTLAVYDNITINKGINNITGGVSFKYLTFENSYLPYGTSYYRFNSVNDFITNQAPIGFGYTYPYQGQDGYSTVHYGLPGAYAQDKINVLPNLTLTAGIRLDMPLYLNTIAKNSYTDTLNLYNPSGGITHYNTSKWPDQKPVVQPRIAFNWSPLKDRSLQMRGGTGVFLGQIPFVWLTNVPGNSGTVTNNVQINNSAILNYLKFQPNPADALAQLPENIRNQYFPTQSGNSVPGQIAAVASDFKMPRVWRSDVGADYKLPWFQLVGTADLMYTKDIYSVYQFNANEPLPNGNLVDSNDHRVTYASGRKYGFLSGAYILENSKLGDAYSATIGISRPSQKGFSGSLFYTAMFAEEVSENPGSQASSAWFYVEHVNNPNEAKLAPSSFYTPHRIVGTLSYRLEYAKHFASTFSIYYNGSAGGRFSYLVYSDINGDGVYNDLMYIPKDAAEMKWAPIVNHNTGVVLFTQQQEIDAFNAYIKQDKYLNAHRGQYASRNGASMPFYHSLSLKFIQEVFGNIGKRKQSLQFSADVVNLPNLLNKDWGVQKQLAMSYGEVIDGSTYKGITTYVMKTRTDDNGNTVLPTSTFINNKTNSSTWGLQIGLKYNF